MQGVQPVSRERVDAHKDHRCERRAGGWRNRRATLRLRICLQRAHTISGPTPPACDVCLWGNNPSLCEHLRGGPALPSVFPHCLCPGSFYPPGNTNCSRRCFFTACGWCAWRGFLSSSAHGSPWHLRKTPTTRYRIQIKEPTVSPNLRTLLFQAAKMKHLLYLEDKLSSGHGRELILRTNLSMYLDVEFTGVYQVTVGAWGSPGSITAQTWPHLSSADLSESAPSLEMTDPCTNAL